MFELNPIYYDPKGPWDFMPPDHRPDGNRPLHDDTIIFQDYPRTATSFILVTAEILDGHPGNSQIFTWQGNVYPKAWCERGHHQKTKIIYRCPVTRELFTGFYRSWTTHGGKAFRLGPRISDDLENGPGYVYVNKLPGPGFITFGSKHIEATKILGQTPNSVKRDKGVT